MTSNIKRLADNTKDNLMLKTNLERKGMFPWWPLFITIFAFCCLVADRRCAESKAEVVIVRTDIGSVQGLDNDRVVQRLVENTIVDVLIRAEEVVDINKSLKNLIEESQRLSQENHKLEEEIRQLKNEYKLERSHDEKWDSERESLLEQIQKEKIVNQEYSQEIQRLQLDIKDFEKTEKDYDHKIKQLEQELSTHKKSRSDQQPALWHAVSVTEIRDGDSKDLDLLSKIDVFAEGDERIKTDTAKLHFHLGNSYLEKGEYVLAAREYYRATALMPDDPDAHYQLALVSSEHLKDYDTALKHYQIYLQLNPTAEDREAVEQKIAEARFVIENKD